MQHTIDKTYMQGSECAHTDSFSISSVAELRRKEPSGRVRFRRLGCFTCRLVLCGACAMLLGSSRTLDGPEAQSP